MKNIKTDSGLVELELKPRLFLAYFGAPSQLNRSFAENWVFFSSLDKSVRDIYDTPIVNFGFSGE